MYQEQDLPFKSFQKCSLTVDHLGELNYKCDICDLKFKKLELKKKHVKIDHHGEKYTCCICGKEYLSDHSLAKHLRKFHNGLNKRKLKAIEMEMKLEEKKQKLS